MRVYDEGDSFRVTVSPGEVADFKDRWPASGLSSKNTISFTYSKKNGDLVDVKHPGSEDGPALVALSEDAQKWGEKKLGINTGRFGDYDDEEMDEEGSDEPQDDDLATSDHSKFYVIGSGKVVLTVDRDADRAEMWREIDAYMNRQGFFPNVWFVSDHGNVSLLERDGGSFGACSGTVMCHK